ncbi:MAG TPA: hypothetical protein VG106_04295, partial [Vicinamibacterales bacterium]|nr:hypothetical protein [Vicinamibacterales bacterium]
RRYLDFYAGQPTRLYTPMADVGIVTSTPMLWVEVLDLLTRHNLSFTVVEPSQIAAQTGGPLETLVVLDQPDAAQAKLLAAYERAGGSVILALPSPAEKGPHAVDLQARVIERGADPNRFALALRRLLGPERRVLDIWNGITVLATPYAAPGEEAVLVTLVNYAYQPLPVQLRVRGTFARVQYESPEEPAMLLPHEHRDGRTEFVVPAVRVGGRIFLSH